MTGCFMNIPNLLSILRLIMIPFFALTFFIISPQVAGIILITSIATDILDGYIARKYDMVTYLGMILDPLADKLMQATVCLCIGVRYSIYTQYKIIIWLPVVFVLKELFMMIGAYVVMRSGRKVVPSKWYGKLAAVVFFAITTAIIFFSPPPFITIILLLIAALFMFFAFVMYIPIFIRINKGDVDE
jgi:cardiolipin synthase